MSQTRTLSPESQAVSTHTILRRLLALDWGYASIDKRDLRLDLLRGLAVFAMIADHWGGDSWLYIVTGGNSFFVSAAEGFIFISGLVVGMTYGAMALKQGLWSAQIKALKRAFTLYKLTVALTLLFAVVSVIANFGWAQELDITSLPSFVWQVVTLHEAMFLTDIPLIYTFLMLAAPIGLWLLYQRQTKILVGASSALWLYSQIMPDVQIPWRIVNSGTFDLAAWQFLFFIGMAIGYHRDALIEKLKRIPRVPYFILSTLLLASLVHFYMNDGTILNQFFPGLDTPSCISDWFQKSSLAPGRLIASVIVFQFLYLAATLLWKPMHKFFGWLLLPLGQNSLYSYTMHVAVIAFLSLTVPRLPSEIMSLENVNTCVQLLAIFSVWVMIRQRFLFNIVPR